MIAPKLWQTIAIANTIPEAAGSIIDKTNFSGELTISSYVLFCSILITFVWYIEVGRRRRKPRR